MKLTIGNTVLENNVTGAHGGVTDLPFRVLCREQGLACGDGDGQRKGNSLTITGNTKPMQMGQKSARSHTAFLWLGAGHYGGDCGQAGGRSL